MLDLSYKRVFFFERTRFARIRPPSKGYAGMNKLKTNKPILIDIANVPVYVFLILFVYYYEICPRMIPYKDFPKRIQNNRCRDRSSAIL